MLVGDNVKAFPECNIVSSKKHHRVVEEVVDIKCVEGIFGIFVLLVNQKKWGCYSIQYFSSLLASVLAPRSNTYTARNDGLGWWSPIPCGN